MNNMRGKELCSLSAFCVCAFASAFAGLGACFNLNFLRKNPVEGMLPAVAGCSALALSWGSFDGWGARVAFQSWWEMPG